MAAGDECSENRQREAASILRSAYCPQSNGKLERYHRRIKSECLRPGTPLCLDDARRTTENYLREYNETRLYGALGDVTPQDKLLGKEANIFAARDRKLQESRERRAENRRRNETHACYNQDAWAEDRAPVRTDPNAASGPEAKSGCDTPP